MKANIRKLLSLRIDDILALFLMTCAIVSLPFTSRRHRSEWAISDRPTGEHDNGYHFFKYLALYHSDQACVYYIRKNSPFYSQARRLGATAEYGGIAHWISYFTSEYLISSQGCNPNDKICTLIERLGLFRPAHVFLQHGVTYDRPPYLMADKMPVKYFITTTPQETADVAANFGHPEGTVVMTGFPRFDALHDLPEEQGYLLVMPTWRKWLEKGAGLDELVGEEGSLQHFVDAWKSLLYDDRILKIAEKSNLEVVVYLHSNMKQVLDPEELCRPGIRCVQADEDLQDIMKQSKVLITDYSSVCFDFAYMKKPSIYYQFDEELYRKNHYPEGWFNYHATAFGAVCKTADEVMKKLVDLQSEDFKPNDVFLIEHSKTFPLWDTDNSNRLYALLSNTCDTHV